MVRIKVLKTLSRLYVDDLNLAQVGDILLVAGSDEALKTFRSTQATFLVDSLDEFKVYLEEKGAILIRGPNKVPTGRNITVRHPDGSVIEYVEQQKLSEK